MPGAFCALGRLRSRRQPEEVEPDKARRLGSARLGLARPLRTQGAQKTTWNEGTYTHIYIYICVSIHIYRMYVYIRVFI